VGRRWGGTGLAFRRDLADAGGHREGNVRRGGLAASVERGREFGELDAQGLEAGGDRIGTDGDHGHDQPTITLKPP
jgi:hypothetical protein